MGGWGAVDNRGLDLQVWGTTVKYFLFMYSVLWNSLQQDVLIALSQLVIFQSFMSSSYEAINTVLIEYDG